jgi:hypothetical protein
MPTRETWLLCFQQKHLRNFGLPAKSPTLAETSGLGLGIS